MRLHGQLKGDLTIMVATRYGYPLTVCQFAGGANSANFGIERDAVLFECVAHARSPDAELSLQKIEIIIHGAHNLLLCLLDGPLCLRIKIFKKCCVYCHSDLLIEELIHRTN